MRGGEQGTLGDAGIWRRRALAGAGLSLGATFGLGATAHADTYIVDSLADDGSDGTLRDAVGEAENNYGFDRVVFASDLTGHIDLVDEDLEISQAVEIVGPGAGRLTVNAASGERIFDIFMDQPEEPEDTLRSVEISGLTLSGGEAVDGGAIRSSWTNLTIAESVLSGNGATLGGALNAKYGTTTIESSVITGNSGAVGGGVHTYSGDRTTVINSTISDNYAVADGGGVDAGRIGFMLIRNSTISGNVAALEEEGDGGGLRLYRTPATILNSTIHGNSATSGGGIRFSGDHEYSPAGKLTVRNSTVTGNTAQDTGGGIDNDVHDDTDDPGTLLLNSVVADNTADEASEPQQGIDVDDRVDAAFSLIEDPRGAQIKHLTPGSNITGVDPDLGPLADNGGQTETREPAPGSPVVDAGNGRGAVIDQRGFNRPVDQPTVANSTAPGADASDMGAFERQLAAAGPGPGPGAGQRHCRRVPATIVASGPGTTFGTPGRDVIAGTLGDDSINGLGGNDLICGFGGADEIRGGPGNDVILSRKGPDRLFGGRGFDLLLAGPAQDRAFGGPGRDRIFGQSGLDHLFGNQGPDKMLGGPRNDRMFGGLGNDRMRGGYGHDEMFGWRGRDVLLGGMGNDLLVGGPGIDTLFGLLNGSDKDRIFGGGDGDRIVGGPGPDEVNP